MAEDSDLERTESASPRRLEQAREEGQVPQSRELSTFLVVMSGVAGLWVMGEWVSGRMFGLMRQGMAFGREQAFDPVAMLTIFVKLASDGLLTILPLMGVLLVAAVGSPILLGGLVFSTKALGPDLTRLDPIQGLGRMFSVHGLAELVKAVLKSALVGGIGAWAIWREREHIFQLMLEPIETSLPDFAGMVLLAALLIVSGLGLLALMDVPFQLWQYHSRLKMTKEEVKQEMKEQDGDPQIKARVRAMQREMARRRMMAAVPKADVVVTNPTHYAVALKYDPAKMGAPVVVAKGMDLLAGKIRELAKEHNVPLLEAPPLARALYAHCELEQSIPAALYTAVAEVMAYVFQLNQWIAQGGLPPQVPADLPVPPDLDPGAPSEAAPAT
ncbi:MAG: flagellar biosynthesis protein FlhB [Rhodocyclaceae bacterium]|nr:flagellar biosynthesis protein FlhB [Rhodocyclaceae bacterium]